MQKNIIYLYPATQKDAIEHLPQRNNSFDKLVHIAARIIELFTAVGIFLCIGVCTLLFFTML